eukprot:COSAG02_NODE_9846_length_2094_cov_6.900593_1_plen_244_part_00
MPPPQAATQAATAAQPPPPAGFGTVTPAATLEPAAGFASFTAAQPQLQQQSLPAGFAQVQAQQTPAGFGVMLGGGATAPQPEAQQPPSLLAPTADLGGVLGNWGAAAPAAPAAGGGTDLLGVGGGAAASNLLGGGQDLLGAVPAGGSLMGNAESGRSGSPSAREIQLTQLSAEDFTMDESPRRGAMPGDAGNSQQQSIMKFIGSLGVDPVVRLAGHRDTSTTRPGIARSARRACAPVFPFPQQ